MTAEEIIWTVVLGIAVIELTEIIAWLAVRVARWAARIRYAHQPHRAAIRAQEWASVIEERPGKLLKLATALCFAGRALALRSGRELHRRRFLWARVAVSWGPISTEMAFLFGYMMTRIDPLSTWALELTCVMSAVGVGLAMLHRVRMRRVGAVLRACMPILVASKVITTQEAALIQARLTDKRTNKRTVARPIQPAIAALTGALIAAMEQPVFSHAHCGGVYNADLAARERTLQMFEHGVTTARTPFGSRLFARGAVRARWRRDAVARQATARLRRALRSPLAGLRLRRREREISAAREWLADVTTAADNSTESPLNRV